MKTTKIEKTYLAVIFLLFVIVIMSTFRSSINITGKNKTEIAKIETVQSSYSTTGYVLRDETIIASNSSGAIPVVDEGEKVGNKDVIAIRFANPDDARYIEQYNNVESELRYYDSIETSSDSYVSDASAFKQRILRSAIAYSAAADGGDLTALRDNAEDFRYYLTCNKVISGDSIDVDGKIAELTAELQKIDSILGSSANDHVTMNSSGYFFSNCDGLERSGNYSDVRNISTTETERLCALESGANVNSIGKLVHESVWYLVCNLPKEQAKKLEVSREYEIEFPDTTLKSIKMKVDVMNPSEDGETVAVVFFSNIMNKKIAELRNQKINIIFKSYTGLLISNPKESLRTYTMTVDESVLDENGNEVEDAKGMVMTEPVEHTYVGVFIRLNNVARFRMLDIIYQNEDIVLSDYDKGRGDPSYLRLNDEILIGGAGYDDKSIIGNGYFS